MLPFPDLKEWCTLADSCALMQTMLKNTVRFKQQMAYGNILTDEQKKRTKFGIISQILVAEITKISANRG